MKKIKLIIQKKLQQKNYNIQKMKFLLSYYGKDIREKEQYMIFKKQMECLQLVK